MASEMDYRARLGELARVKGTRSPVISVYLNTSWQDEHQRDRVRLFLKNELRRVRQGTEPGCAESDLAWIQAQGDALIARERFQTACGVALFACEEAGLREAVPVRVPFRDALVVAEAPFLLPLLEALEETPPSLVVFVDGESARFVPLGPDGAGEEVRLESDVPGHHKRGGWAQLAQSRYQRHIEDHRGRHFEAVSQSLLALAEEQGVARIVMAGEMRNVSALRQHLAPRILDRVVGTVSASRREATASLVARAAELLATLEKSEAGAAVEGVLTEAAKGGRAVAGLVPTMLAARRGAVRRLYVIEGLREEGRVCGSCGALTPGVVALCPECGATAAIVDLVAECVDRVVGAAGEVVTLEQHEGLRRAGGVAALLRYPT